MSKQVKILWVDDDPNISHLVQLYLEKEGYQVTTAARGDDALAAYRKEEPDLTLLDVMLPGLDGWQVLKSIRKQSQAPVIMLTAKDESFDKVLGLELGADDYVTKPFEPRELMARVKAVLRRSMPKEEDTDVIARPGLTISLRQYEVFYDGQKLEMPPKELEVLYFLAAHPGQVFSRDQLLEQVWGYDYPGESTRTVDVHIKRLREKLPNCEERFGWLIRTVWSIGYKFEVK